MFRSVILLAAIIYLTSTFAQFKFPQIPVDQQGACVEKVCQKNSKLCRGDGFKKVMNACIRQVDLSCLDVTNAQVQRDIFKDLDMTVEVIESCQYVSSKAQRTALKHLSKFDRNELDEITRLNGKLWLVENRCLRDSLAKLSKFDKNEYDEIAAIATQCGGTFYPKCFAESCPSGFRCNEREEVVRALRQCLYAPNKQQRRKL